MPHITSCHSLVNNIKKRKMIRKLKKKEYLEIVLFVAALIATSAIFSDWEHFKDGLFGLN